MRGAAISALVMAIIFACPGAALCQDEPAPARETGRESVPGVFAKLPVREVTIFKDGHAFLLHEGETSTDDKGNVVLDYMPSPVIGTFWPYSTDPNAKLTAVVAGKHRISVERTALSLRALLEANIGARVNIRENSNTGYDATILGIPARSAEELEATSPPGSEARLPEKGDIVLLKTAEGTKVIAMSAIRDVTFKDTCRTSVANEEFRNLLTLRLDWKSPRPAKRARVGVVYLQKGIRWIPNYRITIDGKGSAVVELQATLINELTDLEDVTANLVIGVPTFAFQDTIDPITLNKAIARLSQHFQRGSQTAYAFSNAIMSQRAAMVDRRPAPASEPAADLGPELPESGRSEDLYVFTVKHITLKKGERMVFPIVKYKLKYRDVYTLEIPFSPPLEVRRQFNSNRQAELARLFHAPKVMHKIRLVNSASYPLTTAPALIIRDGRVLAQGMTTYTAVGASSDLEITAAVDIKVKKSGTETNRTPNAKVWHGSSYDRIDLAGKISLTNYRTGPADLEVVRHVLGNMGSADHDGVVVQANALEHDGYHVSAAYPAWWHWYGWPSWWYHFNGTGRITWKFRLEPGKSVNLNYTWHYYWR